MTLADLAAPGVENPMKTLMLALVALSLAVVVPGAADAHVGTTIGCTTYSIYQAPGHTHFCVNILGIVQDIVSDTLA